MPDSVNSRIPPRVAQRLAEYCVKQGTTRSEVVIQALDEYLDRVTGGVDPDSLAADLIPAEGIAAVQSDRVSELARKAFGAKRAP